MTSFFSVIDYSIEDAETGRKLIREFSKIQKEWVAHYPGYISASFLVSIDHKRVLNLVRWKDEASYYNFENNSNTEARMQAIAEALKKLEGKAVLRMTESPRYKTAYVYKSES